MYILDDYPTIQPPLNFNTLSWNRIVSQQHIWKCRHMGVFV